MTRNHKAVPLWILLPLVLAAGSPALFGADLMRPGLYEMTVVLGHKGDPDMPLPVGPPRCHSAAELKPLNSRDSSEAVKGLTPEDKDCKIKNAGFVGNKISATIQCKDSTTLIENTYFGDSMEGLIKTTDAKGVVSTVNTKMHRIGDCK